MNIYRLYFRYDAHTKTVQTIKHKHTDIEGWKNTADQSYSNVILCLLICGGYNVKESRNGFYVPSTGQLIFHKFKYMT